MDRKNHPTRRKRLDEPDDDAYVRSLSPAQRIEMVWPLTLQAWEGRIAVEIRGLAIPVLGRDELIKNKRAAGRPKDIADVAALEDEG